MRAPTLIENKKEKQTLRLGPFHPIFNNHDYKKNVVEERIYLLVYLLLNSKGRSLVKAEVVN